MNDPEERSRLADFYSHQLDGELEKIASNAFDLTDVAREVLNEELSRRGLKPVQDIQRTTEPGDDEIDAQRLSTVRIFRDLPEALLAKGCLESAGIEAILVDDNMVRLHWFISNLIGGIKLQVAADDLQEATSILDQPIPEQLDLGDAEDYQQPRCPKCGSLDVSFDELNKPLAYGSAWIGLPLPIHRKGWICHSCRHQWAEEEVDEQTSNPPAS
jgi:hypothetical protein